MTGPTYEFGEFTLDCSRFELSRNGYRIALERKPMELLILLAENSGRLVTRTEIAERLWAQQVFVDTDHGINTAIRKIRLALRDDPENPRFVQTVTGMGYRFVAPAVPVPLVAPVAGNSEPPERLSSRPKAWLWPGVAIVCIAVALVGLALYRARLRPLQVTYTQLTDFTDSAVAPALSSDGRMVAFIRGGEPFLSSDQIYVKLLPNGEARRVTDDSRPKYNLAFSPDGSEIAYTVMESTEFSTYTVSVLGGEPHLLLPNAAGLVWLTPQRLLFSRIPPGQGIHLGVVTASLTGAGMHEIYSPPHQRGMAHYSFPSPDRRWALVVEMVGDGSWGPCRLIALAGSAPPRTVGPAGACTSAGWSPDGRWMYFTAAVRGPGHLWRQPFPQGEAEQITSGPTEENGIAVEHSGRAIITSVGVHQSAIWIRDSSGERSLSSEGEVVGYLSPAVFNPDSTMLYYLLRRGDALNPELWRTVVDSGKSEKVFPGVSMTAFDLSPDGKQVVYTAEEPDGTTQLWLAPVDRNSPAAKVGVSGALAPRFDGRGQILFQHSEGTSNYLERVALDGSHPARVLPYPVVEFQSVSPGRRWIVAALPRMPNENFPVVAAIPLDGGPPRRICISYCLPRWSADGKFLYVPVEDPSRTSSGRSLAIPLGPGESLPDLPAEGIVYGAAPSVVPGAISVPRGDLVPGNDLNHFAWVNTTVHRNLYRISLR